METHIVERLADYINDGELDAEMIPAESEHSAISAGIGSAAAGVRTFTASSSQGLALMHEMLFIVSGNRLPIVMAIANRALSSPINIWNDQQDSIAERDSGWIQLYVESSQEAFDTTVQAFKIAEKSDVLLPVMICLDGFNLTHVYEPVEIEEQSKVNEFLPLYTPIHKLDPDKPATFGPIGFPNVYMEFKKQQQDAMDSAVKAIRQTNDEFGKQFKRSYGNGLIETYKTDDAKTAIVAMGSVCGTARVVVDQLREQGKKVGLIKIKSYRPFPKEDLIRETKQIKNLAIIDRDISFGYEGALYTDVKSALFGKKIDINGFIAGLGGRDITTKHIEKAIKESEKQTKNKKEKIEWLF